jgi:hypothetical protein
MFIITSYRPQQRETAATTDEEHDDHYETATIQEPVVALDIMPNRLMA